MEARDGYRLPDELARHAPRERFVPDELRGACRVAGEGLGREDARSARFRSAAEMVELWGDLALPARVAPYALRDARLGYINGFTSVLVSEALEKLKTVLSDPEERLDGRDYLAGGEFSLADIAYAANLVSLRELEWRGEVSLEDSPNLRAWMGRLEDRGSYEAVY